MFVLNMIELTLEKIIEMHDSLIVTDIGTDEYAPGVQSIGNLEHLIYYQLDPKNDVFRNAAFALHTIITTHPFNNCNKRTGFAIAFIILRSERYFIKASATDRLAFLMKTAQYENTVDDTEKWLKENSYRMGYIQFKLHNLKMELVLWIFEKMLKTMLSKAIAIV